MARDEPGRLGDVPSAHRVADYVFGRDAFWEAIGRTRQRPKVRFLARGAANAVFAFDVGREALVARVALAANTRATMREQVRQESDVLAALQGSDVVPKLWDVDLYDNDLGRPMIIMERLEGRALDYRRADLEAAGRLHATLHDAEARPESVLERPDPVSHLLDEAADWFASFAAWDRADVGSVAHFERAFRRVETLRGEWEARTLIHGDATFWNFIVTKRCVRLIDWDWCRVTTPMADPAHFLSPITTSRLGGTMLSEDVENLYIDAYVERSRRYDSRSAFRADLDRIRPAVVLHSAAWTAAWIANSNGEPDRDAPSGVLSNDQLKKQIEPEFLEQLTQGGYW